ncbi:hypothetical protein D9I42_20155 [Escherichia coli]|nr:hypothetical protein [Escherichia coli]
MQLRRKMQSIDIWHMKKTSLRKQKKYLLTNFKVQETQMEISKSSLENQMLSCLQLMKLEFQTHIFYIQKYITNQPSRPHPTSLPTLIF